MWSFILSVVFILWGYVLIKFYKEDSVDDFMDWVMWITGWIYAGAILVFIYFLNIQHL